MAPELPSAAVLTLIARLVQRPGRKDRRLPLIWLSDRERGTGVLNGLDKGLRMPRQYRVPGARVKANDEDSGGNIRLLLRTICTTLAAPLFGGQPLRFRHYELVEWLMAQDLSDLRPEDRRRRIVALLRGRHRPHERDGADPDLGNLGPQYRLPIWLIRRVVPEVLFRAAVSGKIRGFGRRYRWFMRQPYLAPLQSVNFVGFAERLTKGVRQPEDANQIDKLLVHAFLQDLRRAYNRRTLRLEGWQRTAYPVVLIDDAAEHSDGHRLLQLINDVRNETGQSDPLLVVCSDDKGPQTTTLNTRTHIVESDESTLRHSDPLYHDNVYKEWADALPGSRRARVHTAWYLPISVTDTLVTDVDGPDPVPVPPIGARRPPRLARRSVVTALFFALISPLIVWVWLGPAGGSGCLHIPFRGQVNVRSIDGQCIGYSDSSYFRFNDQPGQERLRYVQDKIFAQNQIARDHWEQGNRTRPYVTIIYLGIFTGREAAPTEEAYSAEREDLEGLAVAQFRSIDEPATSSFPLLNIVIANGGQQMKYVDVAVDMIGDLAAQDPKVVGVIGLDESRDTTAAALARLNEIGLPVIATTLSADYLDRNSRLYLQLAAPNREQAIMMAEYARQVLRVSAARVYWTTGVQSNITEDLYVQTLVDDLELTFRDYDITVDHIGEFRGAVSGVCGYPGVVIFAGRWSEFRLFLNALAVECGPNRPLHVMADDSVNRYMANPKLRENAPSTIPVTYASKSALATCEHLQGAQSRGEDAAALFLKLIQENGLLSPPRCGPEREPVGQRLGLAYDATMLILRAVQDLGLDLRHNSPQEWDPRSIVPVAVHVKMRELVHGGRPFDGVAGT
ncbi:MAG: hypothetical protein ACRDS9_12430, partial [Pseudonocardiaceae bacterium]